MNSDPFETNLAAAFQKELIEARGRNFIYEQILTAIEHSIENLSETQIKDEVKKLISRARRG